MIKVEFIDKMGSDISVVNAARVSFNKKSDFNEDGSFKEGDEKLIAFLARENHWTPFGHASLSFHIKAPIFVARQLVKHTVGLVWNEVSRRYVDSEPEIFYPDNWRKKNEDKNRKMFFSDFINLICDISSFFLSILFTTQVTNASKGVKRTRPIPFCHSRLW